MPEPTDAVLREHLVYVSADNTYQRGARLLQALWRERQGYPPGIADKRGTLGSRLPMPDAKTHLWNFLTENIRDVVRAEVLDRDKSRGKLYGKPRIFDNLLSSQPLCFNAFGELSRDLDAATRVMRRMLGHRLVRVIRVEFEHSPGRRDPLFTSDHSAFDVYVEYTHAQGGTGFVGIEVKYHENMEDAPAEHRERYDLVAQGLGCFKPERLQSLQRKPLNQIWRDHLLAGSMLAHSELTFREGHFALLYPADNVCVTNAIEAYRDCLTADSSFLSWTLEAFVAALEAEVSADWVGELRARYLGVTAETFA